MKQKVKSLRKIDDVLSEIDNVVSLMEDNVHETGISHSNLFYFVRQLRELVDEAQVIVLPEELTVVPETLAQATELEELIANFKTKHNL